MDKWTTFINETSSETSKCFSCENAFAACNECTRDPCTFPHCQSIMAICNACETYIKWDKKEPTISAPSVDAATPAKKKIRFVVYFRGNGFYGKSSKDNKPVFEPYVSMARKFDTIKAAREVVAGVALPHVILRTRQEDYTAANYSTPSSPAGTTWD